jgi:hypothetical protein
MANIDDYMIEVLMRDLVGHDRRPVSFLVYLWLLAEQQRRKSGVTSVIRRSLNPSEFQKVRRRAPWAGFSSGRS